MTRLSSRRLPAALVVAAFLFFIDPVAANDVVFGGTAAFETGATIRTNPALSVTPRATVRFSPDFAIFADTLEFRAAGSVSFGPTLRQPPAVSAHDLRLRLYPSDTVTLDLGLQSKTYGASLLVSPVDLMTPLVFQSGTDGLPDTVGSELLFGTTVFAGPAYVSAFVAPAPAGFAFPEVNASLLDSIGLLASIDDADIGPVVSRTAIDLDEPGPVTDAMSRVSFAAEVGVPVGPVDLTAVYFHGVDRIPTLSLLARVNPADDTFSLTVAPAEEVINAVGMSLQTTAGPVGLWLDGAWVVSRRFGTTNFEPTADADVFINETVAAPAIELVAGGLLWIDRPGLTLVAEYRHGFIGTDRQDVLRLDFPGTAFVSVSGDVAGGLVSLTTAGLILIPDASAAIIGSVRVSPSSELEAFVELPVFLGSAGSLLGGLRSRYAVTLGLTYRF